MKFLQGITPRDYQKNIFNTCKEKNCLVVLPTGLGKTLIALMLTIQRMTEFPGEKVLFLAPTRPLAEQHLNSFKKNLPELFAPGRRRGHRRPLHVSVDRQDRVVRKRRWLTPGL